MRRFRDADGPATHRVFYDAVRGGTGEYYNRYEQAAWAATDVPPSDWNARLGGQNTQVAEMEGRIIGFMSLTDAGYIDLAYVVPKVMGTGVAGRLYAKLEGAAVAMGLTLLTVDASHLSKSFFAKQGWDVVAEQSVLTNGHQIANFHMEKRLPTL